jgi:hypothetical protein
LLRLKDGAAALAGERAIFVHGQETRVDHFMIVTRAAGMRQFDAAEARGVQNASTSYRS